jgi:hypothetical protein
MATFALPVRSDTFEVGNVSDTTVSRASAGVIAVEGKNVAMVSTTVTANTITSGTYAPTVTPGLNCDACVMEGTAKYTRIGSLVTVTGRVQIDATATGIVGITMTLPIASNFGAVTDCNGVMTQSSSGGVGEVGADVAGDVASLFYLATSTAALSCRFTFTYVVI